MRSRRRWLPFVILAPTLVVVVGVLAAIGIGTLGLRELREQGELTALRNSELFAKMLAARLGAMPVEDRLPVLERAALRSGAELMLVLEDGKVVADATRGIGGAREIMGLLRAREGG